MTDKKKTEEKPGKPKHARRIRSFVDLNPVANEIRESVDERLDQLIRLGLGDQSKLAFYRKALSNPKTAVDQVQYRDYVGEALSRLLALVLSDQALFVRIRTMLQTRNKKLTSEEVSLIALEARSRDK